MWSSKNVPIREGYRQIGKDGIICSTISLDTLFCAGGTHKKYFEIWEQTNPNRKPSPEAFAIYTYSFKKEKNKTQNILDFTEGILPSNLEVTVVKGLRKIE
jgi:hypothetical protein